MKYTLSLSFAIFAVLATFTLEYLNRGKPRQTSAQPSRRLTILLASVFFLIGAAVRIYRFGEIPGGIFTDEAAIGYNVWGLLHYGIDFNGFHNPVNFVTFGSGQHALYGYLSMPFIAALGLNAVSVRLAGLLLGLLALIIFPLLVWRIDDRRTALAALFMLAVNPWHILISRWGLDCNPLPAVFTLGVLLLVLSAKNERWFPLAMAVFGLCFYAYATAYFAVPVFLLMAVGWLLVTHRLRWHTLLAGGAALTLAGLPIGLYVLVNTFQWESIITPFLSIPRLPGPARYTEVSVFFAGGDYLAYMASNAARLGRLIVEQRDGLIWNAVPNLGTTYLFSAPLLIGGLWALLRGLRREGKPEPRAVMLFWLVSAVLLGVVMPVVINRINLIFLPLIYLLAKALVWMANRSRLLAAGVVLLFAVWFGIFVNAYFGEYASQVGSAFNQSLNEALDYAAENTDGTIAVSTNQVHMPYILALFYRPIDPREFLQTVDYVDPAADFRDARGFGRYRFMRAEEMAPGEGAYIVENRETALFDTDVYDVTAFKHYFVLIPIRQP